MKRALPLPSLLTSTDSPGPGSLEVDIVVCILKSWSEHIGCCTCAVLPNVICTLLVSQIWAITPGAPVALRARSGEVGARVGRRQKQARRGGTSLRAPATKSTGL